MSTQSTPASTEADAILVALQRIDARLDALESKIASRGPQPQESGAASIEHLLHRLDRIESSVEMIGFLAERVPILAEAAGTSATWAFTQAEQAGVDPIEAGQAAAQLALRAGQPELLELAGKLIDQAPTLNLLLDAVQKVPQEELQTVVQQGVALTSQLAALLATPELARLLEAGPKAVGVAETASTALVETRSSGADPVGPFGAFLALRDPDVQRAVGFGLAVAKRFGRKLS